METTKFEVAIYKSLQPGGITGAYDVPVRIGDIVSLIGEARAVKLIVQNVMYHSVLGAIRSELTDAITAYGKERGLTVEPKATKFETRLKAGSTTETEQVAVSFETDEDFIKRVVAEGIVDVPWLSVKLGELLGDPENAFELFAKEPERKPRKIGKLPKEVEAFVDACFADGSILKLAAKLSKSLSRPIDASNKLEVGKAVQEHKANAAKAATEALRAMLAA